MHTDILKTNRKLKILAIDDDKLWLEQIQMIFEDRYNIDISLTIDESLNKIENSFYDLILLDYNFEGDDRTGQDIYRRIVALDREVDVILISGETNLTKILKLLNSGNLKYLNKPCSIDAFTELVDSTLKKRLEKLEILTRSKSPLDQYLIGHSLAIQKLKQEIEIAIKYNAKDILLIGETGTGKEVVAQAIANLADPSKRIIPIHCGALSDGLSESELFGHIKGAFTGATADRMSAFEAVGGGFIFLDEIGEMPLNQQVKLLRVLQERKVQRVGSHDQRSVNFRCIAASNINFELAITNKTFREDLYYRIAKYVIKIPKLSERIEDIPLLVQAFAKDFNPKLNYQFTDEAMSLLKTHDWPGNIRDLQNTVHLILMKLSDGLVVKEKDVIATIPKLTERTAVLSSGFLGRQGAKFIQTERKRYSEALMQTKGNKDEAAKLLNVSRATFYRRLRDFQF
jgi:DNA-binding NtrC family response regulator